MTTIGLIGGMSWESTAVYYRLLNEGCRARHGGLRSAEVLLHSVDFAPIARMQEAGDWEAAGDVLADSARRLERAGASCIVLATNTMHKVADRVMAATRIPFIHIGDVTARAVRQAGIRRPLLLATRFTMEQGFYRERLAAHGVEALIPDAAGRADVHRIIYEELCRGIVSDASRNRYGKIIAAAQADGADGVILGCTEIGLLIGQGDTPLPVFDTTALHVVAALDMVDALTSRAA